MQTPDNTKRNKGRRIITRCRIYLLLFCLTLIFGGAIGTNIGLKLYPTTLVSFPSDERKEIFVIADAYFKLKDIVHFQGTEYDKICRCLPKLLKGYYKKHHRYPTNDEGLAAAIKEKPPSPKLPRHVFLYHDWNYIGSYSIPLSHWTIPLVYENRRGLDEKLFLNSPANTIPGRICTCRIDDGVYIYSMGDMVIAKQVVSRYRKQQVVVTIIRVSIALLLILFSALMVHDSIKNKSAREPGLLARFLVLFIIVISAYGLRYCVSDWIGKKLGTRYDFRIKDEYAPAKIRKPFLGLMNDYSSKGIITHETVEKYKMAIDESVEFIKKHEQGK